MALGVSALLGSLRRSALHPASFAFSVIGLGTTLGNLPPEGGAGASRLWKEVLACSS